MLSLRSLLLSALLLAPARAEDDPTFLNTVYLIRNAETNTKHVGSGLSPEGLARAACLPSVFGPGTNMSVGYIIAEPPNKKGNDTEAVDTAAPLAAALGLTPDTSCGRGDKDCVGDALSAFAALHPNTSMLVVWAVGSLPDIAEALGANDVPDWPAKRFDLVWTIQKNKIRARTSEGCAGLDDEQVALASVRAAYASWTPSFAPAAPTAAASAVEQTASAEAAASPASVETAPTPALVVAGRLAKHAGRRAGASWAR